MAVIIISTNHPHQESFWQQRLSALRGTVLPQDTLPIVITEDWPGGAGNGLGTLYAYKKAREKGQNIYDKDIALLQKEGTPIAIYHTAGSGKRLTPLTASELNNKSAVKLPAYIGDHQLTILEAVIRQSLDLIQGQKGRLSVFWGDQIFIPAKPVDINPEHHISIYAKVVPFPDEEIWKEQGLSNYGVLSIDAEGDVKLLEKVRYTTLEKIADPEGSVGVSLGSFSLSPEMTCCLMREYREDLEKKIGKLDTDPDFWMPLTLDKETYLSLRDGKGEEIYDRMQNVHAMLNDMKSNAPIFGVTDIGRQALWWDYGSVRNYFNNILKITDCGKEGQMLRLFYQIDNRGGDSGDNCVIRDDNSCLLNCHIRSGQIRNSVLIGVEADELNVSNCVIINSRLGTLTANNSLLYQVREVEDVELEDGTVRADVLLPESREAIKITSNIDRCSKKDWSCILPNNPLTFEELAKKIDNRCSAPKQVIL